MQKWKCIHPGDGTWGFSRGAVYLTDENGRLIDAEGDVRMVPDTYNKHGMGNERIPTFIEYIPKLENK